MDVLVYGLQRSGTNFLEALLERYDVRIVNDQKDRSSPRHKHFRLYADKANIPDPQYYNNITPKNFHDLEIIARADVYLIISKDPYSWLLSYRRWAQKCGWLTPNYHYAEEWGLFYSAWINLSKQAPERLRFVRYIDLLRTPYLELPPRNYFWNRKIKKVPQSERFDNERARYYIEQHYLKEINTDEVNSRISPELIERVGYRVC